MINVADVEASSRWYPQLLAVKSGHGGSDFERLISGDELALMLHDAAGADHHPGSASDGPMGKGVVMYFRVGGDLSAAVVRAKEVSADIVKGP